MNNAVSTEVAMYQQSSLSTRATYAQTLAGAADLIPRGLFDNQTGRPSPAKILLVMETGAMLGLAPMAALAGIDVIEGKAAISPRVALGLFRSAGHKVKIIEEGSVETGDLKVTVILTRKDDPENPIEASFTPQQALRAELIDSYKLNPDTGIWEIRARSSKGKVLPWEAYTEDLCLWRAVGRLGRRGGQDVLMGIGYIPEELDALVDEEGVRVEPDLESENDLIARFKAFDDKAQMAAVWLEQHPMKIASDLWTPRVQAEFDAHLSTLTKDSRKPEGDAAHTPATDNVEDAVEVEEPTPEAPIDPTDYDDAKVVNGQVHSEEAERERARRAVAAGPATEPMQVVKTQIIGGDPGLQETVNRHEAARELSVEQSDAQERAERAAARDRDSAEPSEAEWIELQRLKKQEEAAAAAPPRTFDASALGDN